MKLQKYGAKSAIADSCFGLIGACQCSAALGGPATSRVDLRHQGAFNKLGSPKADHTTCTLYNGVIMYAHRVWAMMFAHLTTDHNNVIANQVDHEYCNFCLSRATLESYAKIVRGQGRSQYAPVYPIMTQLLKIGFG